MLGFFKFVQTFDPDYQWYSFLNLSSFHSKQKENITQLPSVENTSAFRCEDFWLIPPHFYPHNKCGRKTFVNVSHCALDCINPRTKINKKKIPSILLLSTALCSQRIYSEKSGSEEVWDHDCILLTNGLKVYLKGELLWQFKKQLRKICEKISW